jgi:peptidyl-dipeptidase Dcp
MSFVRGSLITGSGALAVAMIAGCTSLQPMHTETSTPAAAAAANPLLATWEGPHGGVPAFDQVRVEHFRPALEAAMAENLAEINRIAADPAPPTFENTIAAMERAGETLNRVGAVYGVWSSTMNTPDFQAVEREMAPRLAAFNDRITQNAALFRRIEAVYDAPDRARLTPEQQRLAWHYHNNFVRAGARLDEASKARLSQINQELAGLFTRFSQNVLRDETDQFLTLRDEAELAGLPQASRDAAAAAATARGVDGAWVIANTRSAMEPFLTYAENRGARERAWRMFVSRGDLGGETTTTQLISEILRLRAERARLLGYPTHAHWRLENTMAEDAGARSRTDGGGVDPRRGAGARGGRRHAGARPRRGQGHHHRAVGLPLLRGEGAPAALRPGRGRGQAYLQLDRLVEGMFWVAGELFGYDFAPVGGARLPPGRARLGGHRPGVRATWGSSTSTPTLGRGSAPGRG